MVEIGEYLKPVSYQMARRNREGRMIEQREIRFDDTSWGYPEDSYQLQAFLVFSSSFVERYQNEKVDELSFHAWLPENQIIRMMFKVEGKEEVNASCGVENHIMVKMISNIRSIMPVGSIWTTLIT